MIINNDVLTAIEAPVRQIEMNITVYGGDETAPPVFVPNGNLKSITIDRTGDTSKFFGFGICQKANIKLLNKGHANSISTANYFNIMGIFNNRIVNFFPYFYTTEVHKDENTNGLSITAYDALEKANLYTVNQFAGDISAYNTLRKLINGAILDLKVNGWETIGIDNAELDLESPNGYNFDGTETIRQVLDAVAEATQSIYYIDSRNYLIFKRLDKDGEAAYIIGKEKYFSLESKTNRRLQKIVHSTELGDNVSATIAASGSTQYVRDNPIWELREDITSLLENAITAAGGLTINQFSCDWRGNPLLEPGDKIGLITKDGETVFSYVLNDVLTYDGGFKQKTDWSYTNEESETEANPASIGDAIKKTYARVDKQNKEITLLASENQSNKDSISSIMLNTENITASVKKIETDTAASVENINKDITTLTNAVNASITAEDVKLEIQSELANGVDKVITSTGFTFDSEGLTVSKTGSEMETQITEDGMKVSKNGEVMLTANNVGVDAVNLHATTYLIVGLNSRFEDYGSRTGCFWIGESE